MRSRTGQDSATVDARPTRRRPLRSAAASVGIGTAVAALTVMPERLAMAIGAGFGRGFARIDSYQRRLAIANLNLVFPEWTAPECRAFVGRNFAELGRNAVEWARMPSLSSDQLLERVDVSGIEHMKAAFDGGRGALVVTGHYGYWEVLLQALALCIPDFELTAVERTQDNPYLKELVGQRRNLDGSELLAQNALSIRRALRRNAAVGVLADHYLSERKGGLLAPFLGVPAWSNSGPAALALSSRSPVLVCHIRRVGESRHCIDLRPIELPNISDRDGAILEWTTRINAAIGAIILREPELWLWSTHRWRGSPAVSGDAYPRRRRRHWAGRS